MALLSGIALSHELQDRYGGHSKNYDPVSVLRVRTSRLFGEPSSSRFPRVGSACTVMLHPSLAGTLSAPAAGTLLPLMMAGILTAEWLSSPGDSPRPRPACPCSPLGLGFSAFPLRRPAIVVLSSLPVGTWCRQNLFFCSGGTTEGFVSFPGFFFILVFPYVSGGRYCSDLLSS